MLFDTGAISDAINAELYEIGIDWLVAADQWLFDNNTNYTGRTRDDLYFEIIQTLDEVALEAGSRSGHSLWVHEGRGPGRMPPVHKIRDWVQVKLGVTNPKKATSIAWAIAKTIAAKGTKAQPFLRESLEALLPEIPGRIERAIINAIEQG